MKIPVVNLVNLGRLPYAKALSIQQAFFDRLKESVLTEDRIYSSQIQAARRSSAVSLGNPKVRNSLLLVEHEPVYTIGIRCKEYDDGYIVRLKQKLVDLNLRADFVKTNRGGLITYHGPGQLVAYPIIYLGDFKTIKNRSIKSYVGALETTIIDTLSSLGLDGAHTVEEYPGVWLNGGERKIAFIGISCKRYVTMHGISINCDCDLSWFDHIVSCGIESKAITSIQQELSMDKAVKAKDVPNDRTKNPDEGRIRLEEATNVSGIISQDKFINPNIEQVSKAFCSSFSRHFDCALQDYRS